MEGRVELFGELFGGLYDIYFREKNQFWEVSNRTETIVNLEFRLFYVKGRKKSFDDKAISYLKNLHFTFLQIYTFTFLTK